MGVQELELSNNPLQCDCYEMVLRWVQQLQHYEGLRHKLFANSRIIGCMEESQSRCHTYYTQHKWTLNVPPFIRAKNAQDMYRRCDIHRMVEPSEPRRFRLSPPMPVEKNSIEED